ncbi:MAG: sulfatase-like hydrolase/transferase [Gemmataceae bacterium]
MRYLFALLLASLPASGFAADRPHVLFLLADDMRADSIAALGNPDVRTPNLDALVKRGFTFHNAYCLGGHSAAVCLPSRNMILSGNAYFRWKDSVPPKTINGPKGMYAPAGGPNFAQTMRDAGYLTYHHGKNGNVATLLQGRFEINKYLKNDDAERKSGEPGKEIVDDAIAFLNAKRDDKPLFMYLAFGNPHDPRTAANTYLDQYDPAKLTLPKNRLPIHPFDNGELIVRDEQLLPWPRTDADLRRTFHEYYATITGLDFHIGRLLKAMRDAGLLENTIVIFSADQGIALGSHGLLGKQNLYDHCMKAPLVFAGPGIQPGTSEALVHLFDIFPTVCEFTGAKPPEKIDGRGFRDVIDGKAKTARSELMLSYRNIQRAIRDDRWKLICYPAVNHVQLFDLKNDPDEMKNLAREPDRFPLVVKLTAQLEKLQKHYGDTQPLTNLDAKSADAVTPEQLRERAKAATKTK